MLPKRIIPTTIKTESVKVPIRKLIPKIAPVGFEILQLNNLFDQPPKDAFHVWRDLESGKYCCQVLIKRK